MFYLEGSRRMHLQRGLPCNPHNKGLMDRVLHTVEVLPAVMLVMAAFMAMLGMGMERGMSSWPVSLGFRLSGMGTPALVHMAAALALAISSSCSLSGRRPEEQKQSTQDTAGHDPR